MRIMNTKSRKGSGQEVGDVSFVHDVNTFQPGHDSVSSGLVKEYLKQKIRKIYTWNEFFRASVA